MFHDSGGFCRIIMMGDSVYWKIKKHVHEYEGFPESYLPNKWDSYMIFVKKKSFFFLGLGWDYHDRIVGIGNIRGIIVGISMEVENARHRGTSNSWMVFNGKFPKQKFG